MNNQINYTNLDTATTNRKLYIGYIGWSSSTLHAVSVDELEDGSGYRGQIYAICKPNTGYHYRIGVARISRRKETATKYNINCRSCKKRLEA